MEKAGLRGESRVGSSRGGAAPEEDGWVVCVLVEGDVEMSWAVLHVTCLEDVLMKKVRCGPNEGALSPPPPPL